MDEKNFELLKEVTKEVAKDVYFDVGKPVIKPTGELVGLLPRAIKAAFLPLEKWVLSREYNLTETKKLLEEKLQNVPPDYIESPEPHVAVPALQYISYCMNNNELRDMYANLLANSMNKIVKNNVHPGFVEIIKQLCPDEAKILKTLYSNSTVPTISLRYENDKSEGIDIVKDFSIIGEVSKCEEPYETEKYFDNLSRLGLVVGAGQLSSLTNKSLYEPLRSHPYFIRKMTIPQNYISSGFTKATITESYFYMTSFGNAFCSICLTIPSVAVVKKYK